MMQELDLRRLAKQGDRQASNELMLRKRLRERQKEGQQQPK